MIGRHIIAGCSSVALVRQENKRVYNNLEFYGYVQVPNSYFKNTESSAV